tara:strand:+ start:157 stop:534 length:378 start_codon:yes stop_codon:yes gene_type:complete
MNHYLSLCSIRMRLDDVVKDLDYEKKVIENIRYCRNIVGEGFRVIFWNQDLLEKECKDFVKRNEKILFEVNTKITKQCNYAWFLIESDGDVSNSSFQYRGDILSGISNYLKMTKFLKKKNEGDWK